MTINIDHYGEFEVVYRLMAENCRIYVSRERPPIIPVSHIRLFERALSFSLPQDYCAFIQTYSDAYVSGASVGEHSLGAFYGLRQNSGTSLISQWAFSRDRLAAYTVPIVDDVGNGGTICIDVSKHPQGEMVWHNVDGGCEVIGGDFNTFMNGLSVDAE